MDALSPATLPSGIRSRFVKNNNGITMHVLEAGFEGAGRPCVLLLHGFPELAYSWRKVMLPLAAAGYHVVAPGPARLRAQRRRGRHLRRRPRGRSRLLNRVRDTLGLVFALGYRSVAAVVGHDYGSPVAAWCALVRPDVFRSVVLMSAPFEGPPALPFDTANDAPPAARLRRAAASTTTLAALPRRASTTSGTTRRARPTTTCGTARRASTTSCAPTTTSRARTGQANKPLPLTAWSASELAKMPTLLRHGPGQGHGGDGRAGDAVARRRSRRASGCRTTELRVYSAEYGRTGFQGGLQSYRVRDGPGLHGRARSCSPAARSTCRPASSPGRATGASTSAPGAWSAMRRAACTRMRGVPPGGRRRALGAAGAARASQPADAGISRSRPLNHLSQRRRRSASRTSGSRSLPKYMSPPPTKIVGLP